MEGSRPGQRRRGRVTLTRDAHNDELRGEDVDVEFEVLEVKQLKLPELTEQFLEEMGEFESEEELRKAVKEDLERQLHYEQQRNTRRQITAQLTESATWELPPAMLRRQSARELERAVMELRRSGFSEEEIRARENELRQNSTDSTSTALKEHFILERISEEEEVDVEEGDHEKEIQLIASQSGETPRRVRAQLEKRGLMDVLRNQIIERKVLQLVEDAANFVDEPFELRNPRVEAIDMAAGGGGASSIPDVTEKETTAEEEAEKEDS
jgi:trigger factor